MELATLAAVLIIPLASWGKVILSPPPASVLGPRPRPLRLPLPFFGFATRGAVNGKRRLRTTELTLGVSVLAFFPMAGD